MWGKTMQRESGPLATQQPNSGQALERSSAPVGPSSLASKTPASVGRTMRVKGEIYSDEELYLDGEFEGILEVRHSLTIGPNGKVKANVKAKEVVVRGAVQGNVEAAGRIVIMTGASIVGNVKTAGIVIEDGAYFKGGIDILRPEAEKTEAEKAQISSSTISGAVKSQGAGM
jgi:cytoskeletal protein CcmA (bactofilin family)